MKSKNHLLILLAAGLAAHAACAGQPSLTIYNQNFAVVRDIVPLDLKTGDNLVKFTEATAHLESDSVILRDPAGKRPLQIVEQNFRADPVSEQLLLSLFEGKTIDFEKFNHDGKGEIVQGKIIRSGYVPHYSAMNRYGSDYAQEQMEYANAGVNGPIIEVNGRMQFSLPGQPRFPTLGDDTILKPTLTWTIKADKPAKLDAELAYVTGGMNWLATYNVIAPEKGDTLELIGWVTMDNQTGKSFHDAKIRLMAGDVNKLRPSNRFYSMSGAAGIEYETAAEKPFQAVAEKTFDEYHLYTLALPTTLLDRESKQVEFAHSPGIDSKMVYIYDGVKIDSRYNGWNYENVRQDREYGTQSNHKVWTMREFINAESNHLGMPLPKGHIRFYRRDTDGQLEFTGENQIDHTPRDEKLRIFTGNAFDIVGERKRTNFQSKNNDHWMDESFEIKLRNRKTEPATVRVVEHLYRGSNWEMKAYSHEFTKTDAQTIEFEVPLKAGEEQTVTYNVHYSW